QESVETYAKHTALRSTVVYGGTDIKEQIPIVRAGIEILIATPGRLLDHVEQKTVFLNQVQILVLDEADRMLDMGFIPDVKRILSLLPKERQSLLFSATFSNDIKKLADEMLREPQLIEVAKRNATAETVEQSLFIVPGQDKRKLLGHLVRSRQIAQAIVFCRTKQDTSRLASALARDGFATAAIHGDKTQEARIEALEGFKNGEVQLLIATDVAARGIDIAELPCVINYEIPYVPEDYVHRIGRTGRAGASGVAISLVAPEEEKLLVEIEKLLKKSIKRETLPDMQREERRPKAEQSERRHKDESSYDRNPEQAERIPGRKKTREVAALLKMKSQ
ncbi:MAG: hypothetical protein RLZZ502_244, partial [Pseudomonadota bacterium]